VIDERREPITAFVGIGSNLNEPIQQIKDALELLDDLPGCHVTRRSSVYRSAPFGPVEQPDFMNAVAELATAVPAEFLLACLQEIERALGREPGGERWGPRAIDLDLLVYGDESIDLPDLQVPHPGITERNFVLLPLREIAPQLVIPGLGQVMGLEIDEQHPQISRID
jgi:2-amino-4-hydroxy-6-hydroxymethyldihydropteridine diphosphokinase